MHVMPSGCRSLVQTGVDLGSGDRAAPRLRPVEEMPVAVTDLENTRPGAKPGARRFDFELLVQAFKLEVVQPGAAGLDIAYRVVFRHITPATNTFRLR
jgi:hypothetical protein